MTYQEFKNKYLGKVVDYDKAYGGQCWDLAQQYITECLGLPASIIAGVGLVNNLLKEPKLSLMKQYFDVIPLNQKQQGDIEVFDWGHIAIMDHWDSSKSLNYYLTQNSGTAEKPVGGVYVGAIQDNPNCMAFRKKKPVDDTNALKDQIVQLQKEISDLTVANGKLVKTTDEYSAKIANLEVLTDNLRVENTELQNTNNLLSKDNNNLISEIEKLNNQIEELKAQADYQVLFNLGKLYFCIRKSEVEK